MPEMVVVQNKAFPLQLLAKYILCDETRMYPLSFSVRFHRGPHRSVPHGAATSIAASKSRPGTILSDVARSQLRIAF